MVADLTASAPTDSPTLDAERETLLAGLEARLDIRFRDRRLLHLALQHGSYGHGPAGRRESYERLELLGDAVLNLIVSDHLYQRFPEASEGDLAKLRARIVSEPWLARITRSLDLGKYVLMGKGEEKSGGRSRPSMLADVLEAVLGAVYVDSGFGVAHAVATRWLQETYEDLETPSEDYKSQLQELLQERERRLPRYRISSQEGPDHAKVFVAIVEAGGRILGEGQGASKKQAEQAAARVALQLLARRGRRGTQQEAPERPSARDGSVRATRPAGRGRR